MIFLSGLPQTAVGFFSGLFGRDALMLWMVFGFQEGDSLGEIKYSKVYKQISNAPDGFPLLLIDVELLLLL